MILNSRPILCLILIVGLTLLLSLPSTGSPTVTRGTAPTPAPTPVQKKETLWQWLLRISGISATSATQKGDDFLGTGDVCVADRLKLGERAALQLTKEGGYRWPLFMLCEQSVLALKGDSLVKISLVTKESQTLFQVKGVIKLIGFTPEDVDSVAVQLDEKNGSPPVGLLSLKTGKITNLPPPGKGKEDESIMTQVRNSVRTYGDTVLYVKTEIKNNVNLAEVYLKELGSDAQNISLCDTVSCGQPALSPEGRYVVFVRAAK